METVTYNEMDWHELDDMINKEFDLPYEFECACIEEWSNDSTHKFVVKKKDFDKYQEERFEEALKKEKSYTVRAFLSKLCSMGKIPEGNYLIKVCW